MAFVRSDSDPEPHMWGYYKDKCVSSAATLEHYYPGTLAANPQLQQAVTLIRAGEALIEQTMIAAASGFDEEEQNGH